MSNLLRHPLSDREVFLVGEIVALWAMLEHEIFLQTFDSFSDEEITGTLPSAMNNMNFEGVKNLWKSRVIENHDQLRKNVLSKQCEEIERLKEYRNAIVHGMWEFSKKDLAEILASRIKKKELRVCKFTAKDLEHFALTLGQINYHVRYPGGLEDRAQEMAEVGGYMSRDFIAAITGNPLAKEFFRLNDTALDKSTPTAPPDFL